MLTDENSSDTTLWDPTTALMPPGKNSHENASSNCMKSITFVNQSFYITCLCVSGLYGLDILHIWIHGLLFIQTILTSQLFEGNLSACSSDKMEKPFVTKENLKCNHVPSATIILKVLMVPGVNPKIYTVFYSQVIQLCSHLPSSAVTSTLTHTSLEMKIDVYSPGLCVIKRNGVEWSLLCK